MSNFKTNSRFNILNEKPKILENTDNNLSRGNYGRPNERRENSFKDRRKILQKEEEEQRKQFEEMRREKEKKEALKETNFPDLIQDIFIDPDKKILENKDTLLIITTNYSEDSMHQIIKSHWEKYNYFIVLFTLAHLQINILNHSYVPKHIKLTNEEKIEFLQKYNVNESQIPEISRFDPVARAICLRPNDVCKIIRYDKISYNNDYYRICVS